MNQTSSLLPSLTRRGTGWFELELGLLVLLVVVIYFTRIDHLTIRGEEPRRARVAVEMLESGDWIIPRQQGVPFLSRPPLGSWVIAWAGLAHGQIDLLAVRLPSVLSTLLTSLLVYLYGRAFLSATGALAAGVAYATFIQVLQLGRLAETEAVFTLLVAASLFIWHAAYMRRWSPWLHFSAGYTLAALGALAKGPQAPVYFAASMSVYLLWRRDWRTLFSRGHLVGILAFVVLLAAWQIPVWYELGFSALVDVWHGDVMIRFADLSWSTIFKHFAAYPLEVFACTLPWSVFVLPFVYRSFRSSLHPVMPYVSFLAVSLAVTFPTCWLTPGARGRYFMPLYPCIALLMGLAIDRSAAVATSNPWLYMWKRYLRVFAVLMIALGVTIGVVTFVDTYLATPLAQPANWSFVYVCVALAASATVWLALRQHNVPNVRQAILAVGLFVGLTSTIVSMNQHIATSEDTAAAVAQLKKQLPPGVELISIGPVHHRFAYHYQDPIPLFDYPVSPDDLPPHIIWFCTPEYEQAKVALAIPWEPFAVIACDRRHRSDPRERMVIGRRLPTATQTASQPPPLTR